MKKRTSVYVDAELLEWAKQNSVNISQLLENALKSIKNGKNPVNALDSGSSPVGVQGFESLLPH
ncbi:MAG: type II toxin-antitoxin system CcdA family antitoxin [Archaeoglobaceae archaeon]